MYELRFDKDAEEAYSKADDKLAGRLNRCFEQLRENPLNHPNIKASKGKLEGLYRYRSGDWRIIYEPDKKEYIVNILQIVRRNKAYR